MKNKIIIATAAAAGAALIIYMMKRRNASKEVSESVPSRKNHHRTDVFSNAKNYSE